MRIKGTEKFATAIFLLTFGGMVLAKCLPTQDESSYCRYPAGDSWCVENDENPYAYRDNCLREAQTNNTERHSSNSSHSSGTSTAAPMVAPQVPAPTANAQGAGDNGQSSRTKQYGRCNFIFKDANLMREWQATGIALEIKGAEEARNKIYNLLCSRLSSEDKDIYILPGKDGEDQLDSRKDGDNLAFHLKVQSSGCVSDLFYGVINDKFSVQYKDNCRQSECRAVVKNRGTSPTGKPTIDGSCGNGRTFYCEMNTQGDHYTYYACGVGAISTDMYEAANKACGCAN